VRTWQGTARFESSAVVSASAEQAWALLSSPEAWSLAGGLTCVFDVPARLAAAPPGERLRFRVAASADGQVFGSPMRVTDAPGRLQLDVQLGESHSWEFSADQVRRGTRLRIRGTAQTRREQVVEAEAQLRAGLASWLERVRAVLDGSQPWPARGVPDPLRAVALAVPQPQGAMQAAVAVEVGVPAEAAARLLRSPEVVTAVRADGLAWSSHTVWIGTPPGDMPGELGSLGCFVARTPEGATTGTVAVCIDSYAMGYAVRQLRWPYDEISRSVTPHGAGSRLELMQRFLPRQPELRAEQHLTRAREMLTYMARSLKAAIEQAARGERTL
jgi:hypothetical protein